MCTTAPCSYGPEKNITTASWCSERVFDPGESPFGATVWAQGRGHVKLCPLCRRSRRGRSDLPSPQPSPIGRGGKHVSLGCQGHGQDLIHGAREHKAQTTAELGGNVEHILTIPL